MSSNGLYYSPTWEPTIPAGEYIFPETPGSPEASVSEYLNVNLTEPVNFTSNSEVYSTMTARYIVS